jgi:hypothetical protein
MNHNNGVIIPDLPAFLVRDANNESEITKMSKSPTKTFSPAEAATASVEAPAKAPRTVKAKSNGAGKPAKAAKAKAAKPAKAAKAKAKQAAKAPAKPVKLDQFGFRVGTLKSRAAAIYASKRGATLAEVRNKLESTQFNLLTELKGKGFKIREEQVQGEGTRKVTRYTIQPK